MQDITSSVSIETDLAGALNVEQRPADGAITISNTSEKVVFVTNDKTLTVRSSPDGAPICPENLFLSTFNLRARNSVAIQEGTRIIPPQCSLTVDPDLSYRADDDLKMLLPELDNTSDLLQVLEQEVFEITAVIDRPLYLNLSGGFDSTALLASLPDELRRETTAITWIDPDGNAQNDRHYAQLAAKRLGVRQIELALTPEETYFTMPRDLNKPIWSVETSILAYGLIVAECSLINQGGPVAIMNGHGGDHLLVDPLHTSVLLEIARRDGLPAFYRKLLDFAHLRSKGIPSVVKEALKRTEEKFDLPLSPKGLSCLSVSDPNSGKIKNFTEWRRKQAMEAMSDNLGRIRPDGVEYLCPFTSHKFMAAALSTPASALFDRTRTRMPLRAELQAKHGEDLFSRRDKGHTTGEMQKAVREKFDWLESLVTDGVLARAELIDLEVCQTELRQAAMGASGVNPWVMRLVAAEMTVLAQTNGAP